MEKWFVAMGPNTWGRGHSQEEAVKNLRGAGFSGRLHGRALLFIMPPGAENPYVNDIGQIIWTWADGADKSLQPDRVKL